MTIQFNNNTDTITASGGTGALVGFPINGFKNRIINGAMMIDQRNAGASVTPVSGANVYTLDRWLVFASQASKFTLQQNAAGVTPPPGFNNYLGITSSSAYTVGASELFILEQHIEGYNVSDLGWGSANASTVTLSFWVRSSLTGNFGGSLRNPTDNRSYPFSYTISSANTWEQKTITVSGDTTGTWPKVNGEGVRVCFGFGVGSTYSGAAGAWAGATIVAPTGATSVVGTSGATFYITGVQLERGSTATSFDYRPYGTELSLCQRYYYGVSYTANNGMQSQVINSTGTPGSGVNIVFPQVMRSAPTCTGSFAAFASGSTSGAASFNGNVNGYSVVARAPNQYSATLDAFTASAEL